MGIRNLLMLVSLGLSVAIGMVVARGRDTESSATGRARGKLIGFSMDTLKEARWQVDRKMVEDRCRELGVEVKVLAANSDDSQQIRDVQSLLSSGVQAIMILPHDAVAMAKAVKMAHDAGVPVISYDRLIRDADVDLYVGFDSQKVGQLQAQYLVDHLPTPGKGKIVRVYGAKTDNNSLDFKAGQDQALKPYLDRGDIIVVHEDWAEDWLPENAKKIVNAAITSAGPTFDAVLASNDGTAGGAIQALTEAGMAGKTLVTGQDAELAAAQRIVAGTQAMSVYKPIKKLAAEAVDSAVRLAQGKPVIAPASAPNGAGDVPSDLVDVVLLTKENIPATVVKDGFLSYDEIYRGIPDADRPPRP